MSEIQRTHYDAAAEERARIIEVIRKRAEEATGSEIEAEDDDNPALADWHAAQGLALRSLLSELEGEQ